MHKRNKAGQDDWFYPVILSSLIVRPSDEEYKAHMSDLQMQSYCFSASPVKPNEYFNINLTQKLPETEDGTLFPKRRFPQKSPAISVSH